MIGLSVPGYSERTINLTALAPAAVHLVTHVRVESGHLAAWVTDTQSVGQYAVGSDYVPPAANAATTVVLPGLGDGLASRELLLYVPGSLGAQVTVHVVGASGSFVPSGMSSVLVAPGKAVAISMSKVSVPAGASLVVSSNLPVLAAERSALPRPGTVPTDSVYAAAAAPIIQAATDHGRPDLWAVARACRVGCAGGCRPRRSLCLDVPDHIASTFPRGARGPFAGIRHPRARPRGGSLARGRSAARIWTGLRRGGADRDARIRPARLCSAARLHAVDRVDGGCAARSAGGAQHLWRVAVSPRGSRPRPSRLGRSRELRASVQAARR